MNASSKKLKIEELIFLVEVIKKTGSITHLEKIKKYSLIWWDLISAGDLISNASVTDRTGFCE